jgi:hypothetical protein
VDNKTLTIILCQTREGEHTFDSLKEKVLTPLSSDLAFCGSADADNPNIIIQNAKYSWNFPEPNNWAEACDNVSTNNSDWRNLCKYGNSFLGGSGYGGTIGSGLIIMYWREILRQCLTVEIVAKYEWFVITRSDFKWIVEHPDVKLLNSQFIYFLDGEKYGGISDRHVIFHASLAREVLSIANPIFHDSKKLETFLENSGVTNLNPERYIDLMLARIGLERRIKFLPYLGFAIRHEGTDTRWSAGVYSKSHGHYIKYPTELKAAKKTRFAVRNQSDWSQLLSDNKSVRVSYRIWVYNTVSLSFVQEAIRFVIDFRSRARGKFFRLKSRDL